MPRNHLEDLVAEWYEFRGYFVRRNVQVGKLAWIAVLLFSQVEGAWGLGHLWVRKLRMRPRYSLILKGSR
jgi:hypothetical protein